MEPNALGWEWWGMYQGICDESVSRTKETPLNTNVHTQELLRAVQEGGKAKSLYYFL